MESVLTALLALAWQLCTSLSNVSCKTLCSSGIGALGTSFTGSGAGGWNAI